MASKRHHVDDPVQAVVKLYATSYGRIWIGIDPGINGGIAFLPEDRKIAKAFAIDMPIEVTLSKRFSRKKGKSVESTKSHYDHYKITRIFDAVIDNKDRTLVGLERQMPRPTDTGVTAFAIGCGYAMWQLFFTAFAIPYEEILPAVWKRKMNLLKSGKDASRMLAKKLFPDAAEFFEFKSDDGRAEAMLVAESARRRNLE